MKIPLLVCVLAATNLSYAQSDHIDLIEAPLTDDPSQAAWEITRKEQKIKQGLSSIMKDRVLRKGNAFRANTKAIQKLFRGQQFKKDIDIKMSIQFFEGDAVSQIAIHSIKSSHGRIIMRGELEGIIGSQVRLVEYNNSLTGAVSYPDKESVLVLLSDGMGVSAAYEVDMAGLQYD